MKRTILMVLLCLIGFVGFSQELTVKGVVTNKLDGSPIPGVSISVLNTTNGTITDFNGNYSISVQSGDVLVFSFIGFKTQEVETSSETINIELEEDLADIDEVLVIGYGVQKKSVVTASISSIKAKDISKVSTGRVEAALQGRTAGVTVLPTSGAPGATSKIRIRGTGSNGISDPLYIVDGMKVDDISFLNPDDILSTEILKDAASAAIYGTEGANGVVLLTTKSGSKNKMDVSYNFQYGIQNLSVGAELMNAEQYSQFMSEAIGKEITGPAGENYDTDWLDEISESAPLQRHSLSVSGGGEKSTYYVSGSYLKQDGAIGGDNARFERYTFRVNTKNEMKKWLEVGNSLSFSHSKRNKLPEDDEYRSIVNSALLMDPFTPVIESDLTLVKANLAEGRPQMQNANGQYYGLNRFEGGEVANPVAFIENTNDEEIIDKLVASFYGTLKPIEGLSLTSRIGLELTYLHNHAWTPKYYFSNERSNTSNVVTDLVDKYYKTLWENFASYNKVVGDHNITLLGGMSYEALRHPNFEMTSTMEKEGEQYAFHTYAADYGSSPVMGTFEEINKISYFGRVSYDYKNKYMLQGSIRRDGSSILPEQNKWATFKAISGGWVLTGEDFLEESGPLSYLKLRASWGENGSMENVIANSGKELWTAIQNGTTIRYPGVDVNDPLAAGTRIGKFSNANLIWEKSVQTDIGIDMRFFNDKLSFSADYYTKETDGLIAPLQVAESIGAFGTPSGNIGTIMNKGFEFEANYTNRFDNGVKLSVSANISTLDNEVTKVGNGSKLAGANVRGYDMTYFYEGYPVWYFEGYKTNGINPADGSINVVDVSEDGEINGDDKTMIGSPHPDLLFGGNVSLEYKNFDLNCFFQGTYGNEIFMAWYRTDRPDTNKPSYFFTDRWTPNNTNASMPKPTNDSDYLYRSDLAVGDGSYVRIKQLQLGYTFPKEVTKQIGLGYLRTFVSLDDYFTFTKYKGMDPEAGSMDDNRQGVDKGLYPTTKKVMFGLSVKF